MIGKAGNNRVKPYALGLVPQTSVYGATIPVIMGRARSSFLLTWQENLREIDGTNKVGAKKGETPSFAINAQLMIGHNPISALLQFWRNKDEKYLLEFDVYSEAITPGGVDEVTIPDDRFYMLLGVTLTQSYDQLFNDYGAQGPASLAGNYEKRLWNSALVGPDRVNMSGWRHYPYVYHWIFGTAPTINLDVNAIGALPAGTLKLYYARIPLATEQHQVFGLKWTETLDYPSPTPLAELNAAFERIMGTGPEYLDYEDQIILYPSYAGIGSGQYELNEGQMLPNIVPEIQGAFAVHPEGDADFVDMVEDIFKGVAQSTVDDAGTLPAYSPIRHGLDCYEFPGMIQKKLRSSEDPFTDAAYDLQTTVPQNPGSILIAVARNESASPLTIADTQANTWVPSIAGSPPGKQVWMVYPTVQEFNTVTIDPPAAKTDIQIMEFFGLDNVEAQETFTGTDGPILGSITTEQAQGNVAYLLAILIADGDAENIQPLAPPVHWKNLMVGQGRTFSMYRIVHNPGEYAFEVQSDLEGGWTLQLIAFTAQNPPVTWPKPLGDILDIESLELVRHQDRANGLWGSLVMDSQRPAADYLTDLYLAMNAAPVWMGFKLHSIPWSETSMVGNGSSYLAPTSGGPIAHLEEKDFVASGDKPMIVVDRKGQVDSPNLFQLQHPNRSSDYHQATLSEPIAGAIALFGLRKEAPKVLTCIQDSNIGRKILKIISRRSAIIRNTYTFTLQARWRLLSPMDLVTLTDEQIGMSGVPVRLTSITENDNRELECEAEDFVYGVHAPVGVQAD